MLSHLLRTSKRTITRARALRKNQQTPAEHVLWEHLCGSRFLGMKFRRQVPIGPFITDFLCVRHRLIIELDGKGHAEKKEYDSERTAFLELHGYRVVRFTNDEVFGDLERVLQRIAQGTNRCV